MSTKMTIAHGDKYHLYGDFFDYENVYLELRGVDFEASPGCVTVVVPKALWEALRKHEARTGPDWSKDKREALRKYKEARTGPDWSKDKEE